MTFALQHTYLWLLIIITIGLFVLWYTKLRQTQKFDNTSFWTDLHLLPVTTTKNIYLPLLMIFIIGLTLSIMRPVWGTKTTISELTGADVIFTLDVSESMNSLDMSYGHKVLDRLTTAKLLIADFVSAHPENRYGLVLFAGDAFVSSPLTDDTNAFLTFLNAANPSDVSIQGTDIVKAVQLALGRFVSNQNTTVEKRGQAIILISDGGEDAPVNLPSISATAETSGVQIITLGIGSDKPTPIPTGQDVFGRISYKRHNGQVVYTKLNPIVLKQLASNTRGQYIRLKSGADLDKVAKQLQTLDTSTLQRKETTKGEEQYAIFLWPTLFVFILYWFLPLVFSLWNNRKILVDNK